VTRTFDLRRTDQRATGLRAAVSTARRGRLVLLPTESVYALLTDAFSRAGVDALRVLKGRAPEAALPVAVASVAMLRGVADRLPAAAQELVDAFWPGPLTLVCRQQPSLAWTATGGGGDLTVRMPLHPVALEVVRGVGPSVLMAAGCVPGDQPDAVDVVLDGGPPPEQPAVSAVVDVRGPVPVLVRAGAIPTARLSAVAPTLQVPPEPPV
jgi:tRNA threonylcarbamoyl adenosine modification protein (Sua5/YciO/YrdC/YwlC family)